MLSPWTLSDTQNVTDKNECAGKLSNAVKRIVNDADS